MSDPTFTSEFYTTVNIELLTSVPSDVRTLNHANRTLWREPAHRLIRAALPEEERQSLDKKLPRRRAGRPKNVTLEAAWGVKLDVQKRVNLAVQHIRRNFAAARRPARTPTGSSRSSKWRHKRASALVVLQRKPDDETMLSSDVIKGWLSDTSSITKPLLVGEALAEHLRRRHEEVSHARVKATMAPGPVAAKRFAATFPFPGAWSALATLDFLDACPPDASHTGPDGDALRTVPLVVDIDAEFAGCYGVHGPGVPRGPAAFARTTLSMARLMISHVHGTAHYGRDPALPHLDRDDAETEAAAESARYGDNFAPAVILTHVSTTDACGCAMHGEDADFKERSTLEECSTGQIVRMYEQLSDENDVDDANDASSRSSGGHTEVPEAFSELTSTSATPALVREAVTKFLSLVDTALMMDDSEASGSSVGFLASKLATAVDEHRISVRRASWSLRALVEVFANDVDGVYLDAAPLKHSEIRKVCALLRHDSTTLSPRPPVGDFTLISDAMSRRRSPRLPTISSAARMSTRAGIGRIISPLSNERTAKMLSILAEDMTGPALPDGDPAGAGAKRKLRPAPAYNLADLRHGKGTPNDPISFFELAKGTSAQVASLSFYQLLTLKALDVIGIKQVEPFGDVLITRTVHFMSAMKEITK